MCASIWLQLKIWKLCDLLTRGETQIKEIASIESSNEDIFISSLIGSILTSFWQSIEMWVSLPSKSLHPSFYKCLSAQASNHHCQKCSWQFNTEILRWKESKEHKRLQHQREFSSKQSRKFELESAGPMTRIVDCAIRVNWKQCQNLRN